jgi:hypothetical protein
MTTVDDEQAADTARVENRVMTIRGTREPRYWRQSDDAYGHYVSSGQPGPIIVVVTHQGIQIMNDVKGSLRPSTVRWLSLRLIEAAAIYETEYGGDGSVPRSGAGMPRPGRGMSEPGREISPVGGDLPPEPEKKWVCGCGKGSINKGAMVVHEKTCQTKGLTEVTGGQD